MSFAPGLLGSSCSMSSLLTINSVSSPSCLSASLSNLMSGRVDLGLSLCDVTLLRVEADLMADRNT